MPKKVVIDEGILIQADGGFYAAQYFCWVRVGGKKSKNYAEGDLIFRFETREGVFEIVEKSNNHIREHRMKMVQAQYVRGMIIFNKEQAGKPKK